MNLQQPSVEGLLLAEPGRRSAAQRYGLLCARIAWLGLAGLILALLVVAAPRDLAVMQTPCVSRLCVRGQIPRQDLPLLADYGISLETFGAGIFTLQFGCALMYIAVASAIFRRRSHDWTALLGSAMLLAWGATTSEILTPLDALAPLWWWLVTLIWLLSSSLITYFFFLFPSGRFVPHWTRWLAPVWIAGTNLHDLLPLIVGRSLLIGRLTSLFFDAWMLSLALAQLYRYRYVATPEQRRQTRWVLTGVVVGLGGTALLDLLRIIAVERALPIPSPVISGASYVLMMFVPIAFGMAILRDQLYGIDSIINRTLVYAGLTACVIGLYGLVVGYLGTLFHRENNLLISLVATGMVAVLFQPLRERLQRVVNRLMYGDRDDPYAVVSRLGRRIEETIAPDAVLPTIVQTVREALKLPYVAITIAQDGEQTTAATTGSPVPEPLVLPLSYGSEIVGQLILGPRAPGEGWSQSDRRLLLDLARQSGIAVHAMRLTLDLQQARARLITAREEERRRLRRDLHDGLGPTLAALALQADTARDLVRSDPDEAEALLDNLTHQSQAAVVDIRRLVYALRPPALDDLGLIVALRTFANTLAAGGVTVTIEASEPFAPLPAAVEVAAYRIIQEALTNVVRHAQARRCTLRLIIDARFTIEIADDGCGIAPDAQVGVGLQSMRERARELGGDCRVERSMPGGTIVQAWLPLDSAAHES